MFNEELKRRFIKERQQEVILPNNYLECQFEKIESLEKKLNKDLSSFTFYEIQEYYKMLNLTVTNSLKVMNSQFSLYTQWCLQQNLVPDGQNHFLEFRNEDFHECINKALEELKIISKNTILNWVEELINPRDQFVLLGLFEGIKGKDFIELMSLRPEDIRDNVATLCTGRKLKLSDTLISIIENCIEENKYYSITGEQKKIVLLANNGYIFKDYPNTKASLNDTRAGRKIYNALQRTLQYLGQSTTISANNIVESGRLEMIKTKMKQTGLNSKEILFSPYFKEIEERYGSIPSRKTYILKYEDYLQ